VSVDEVIPAARALARHGLVDAFGHVSARKEDTFSITPPVALGTLTADDPLLDVPVEAGELPDGVPKEAWIHAEIFRRRSDVGGICRAQPGAVNATVTIRACHGQGALVGATVPVHDDARLVRARELGEAVAASLGDGEAIVLRGNGAVTAASSPGIAMALMYILEASARVNLAARATPLSADEIASWRAAGPELLRRLWEHLR
jgi:HCOMODA/2-hydroxy-3-carboxy-muconic semialdehyde decarboxylase